MIMRLLIAYIRWVWGLTPAFATPDTNNEAWCFALTFGILLDIAALVFVAVIIWDWHEKRKDREDE